MKTIKLTLTVEQANLVEDVISNRMVRIYDNANDEERAELEKSYKALEAVWKSLIIATSKVKS